jgi:hypothetical protein
MLLNPPLPPSSASVVTKRVESDTLYCETTRSSFHHPRRAPLCLFPIWHCMAARPDPGPPAHTAAMESSQPLRHLAPEPLSFTFTLYQKLNTSRQGFGASSTSSCRAPEHRSAEPTQKGAAMPVGKAPRPTAAGLAPPGMGGWLNLQAGPNLHCPVFM